MRWVLLVSMVGMACADPNTAGLARERAQRLAIENALTDDHDVDSPRAVATRARGTGCGQPHPVDRVGCLLDHPRAGVRVVDAAPRGETSVGSWIFRLQLPSLPSYVFYVIVPRSGGDAVYNYGVRTHELSDARRTRPYRSRTARPGRRAGTR
ncbi:MAG TPA: hypothetical protein VML75_16150 [Kofleriaceae bacterium]|nr:hypothetical protein [Kofleriaceae bacterium]